MLPYIYFHISSKCTFDLYHRGPEKGTEEFEKECLNNVKRFDNLRTEREKKNPDNPHGYHRSSFRKELNSGPRQIPKQVGKDSGEYCCCLLFYIFRFICTTTSNNISTHPSIPHTVLSELWGLLKIPNDLYTNPEKYPNEYIYLFNLLVTHYDNVKDIKSVGGRELLRILFSIPWDEPLGVDDPLVLALLNYCTMETALSLLWGEHPGRKKKKDSSELSALAWNWILDSVGEVIYPKMLIGDVDDIAYMKDTKLSQLLSPEDLERHLKSWNEVLKGANEVCDHIAPLSKETAKKWGERVHGSVRELERHFRDNPGKIISADYTNLTVPFHPSASYDEGKQCDMHIKSTTNQSAMTDLRRKFRGHEKDVSTHDMDIFKENTVAFAQIQAHADEGRALGRENNSKLHKLKKAFASAAKSILGEEADAEAIFQVGIYGQIKHLLTRDEKELYAWALLREDSEDGLMKKMKQYANIGDTMDKARKAVKNNTADDKQQDMVARQQKGNTVTMPEARKAVKDGTADDDQQDMVDRQRSGPETHKMSNQVKQLEAAVKADKGVDVIKCNRNDSCGDLLYVEEDSCMNKNFPTAPPRGTIYRKQKSCSCCQHYSFVFEERLSKAATSKLYDELNEQLGGRTAATVQKKKEREKKKRKSKSETEANEPKKRKK